MRGVVHGGGPLGWAVQVPAVLMPVSPPTASLLRIPCELVLDMGFIPALQDPGSHERQLLLHSFNRTVRMGQGRAGELWLGALCSASSLHRLRPSSCQCLGSCGWR